MSEDKEAEEFAEIVKGIHTKTLQKLLLIWYNIFHDWRNSPVAYEMIRRERQKQPHP